MQFKRLATIAALALVFAGFSIVGALASNSAAAESESALLGVWKGAYRCRNLPTDMSLTISTALGGQLTGFVEFHSGPDAAIRIPSATYRVAGKLQNDGLFKFEPIAWINRPANLFMGALLGKFDDDNRHFQGDVVECGKDSFLSLRKLAQGEPLAGVQPGAPDEGTTVAAAGAATAAPHEGRIDPYQFLVSGVHLGMTRAEALAALKQANPNLIVQHEYHSAETDFRNDPSFFGDGENGASIDAAVDPSRGSNWPLVSIWLISRAIADDVYKHMHVDSKYQLVYVERDGKRIGTLLRTLPKDPLELFQNGLMGAGCSQYSPQDAMEIRLGFTPSIEDPRVMAIRFSQSFCNVEHLPDLKTMHDALFRRFPKDATLDGPIEGVTASVTPGTRPIFANVTKDMTLYWRYDMAGHLIPEADARRLRLLKTGLVFENYGVAIDARVKAVANTGESEACNGIEIFVRDFDKAYKFSHQLTALNRAHVQNQQAAENKKLDKDQGRAGF